MLVISIVVNKQLKQENIFFYIFNTVFLEKENKQPKNNNINLWFLIACMNTVLVLSNLLSY